MKLRFSHLIGFGFAAIACTDGAGSAKQTTADPAEQGDATIFLRQHAAREGTNDVFVDVLVRGVPNLHGVAFRITWDPSTLSYVSSESSREWSKSALAIAREATPGHLLVAWAEKGETGLSAAAELVLGSLRFESRTGSKAALAFKTERCQAVDKKGAPIRTTWRGSDIVVPTL